MRNSFIKEINEMRESGFDHVDSSERIISFLESLLQIMLDPENDSPQFSKKEAWKIFKEGKFSK